MKKLFLHAALAWTTVVSAQNNLIQNGSLESWNGVPLTPANWTLEGNVTQNNTEFTDGSSSALFINGNSTPVLIAENYFLEAGKTYQLSFDFKVKTANSSFIEGQQQVRYELGGVVSNANRIQANRNIRDFDWNTITGQITPNNSENFFLEISLTSTIPDAFEVYMDNISIVETDLSLQRSALIALYNATNGPAWTTPWNINNDISTWNGVILDGSGNVIELNLASNNLSGTIPSEIGNLTHIQVLNLDRNQIMGQIPLEIGNLTNLTRLNFFTNQLSGPIPEEISNLTNLGELYFANNYLTGPIPISFNQLTNLDTFLTQNNKLSGNLDFLIDLNAPKLGRFIASENDFTGEIPKEIGNLTGLFQLVLSDNQLSGNIPSELGNLTSLGVLELSNNKLEGEIPMSIFNLTQLSRLYLSSNSLTGSIPSQIGNLTELFELDLSKNNLSGEIPIELANASKLFSLNLSFNELTGSLPAQLGTINSIRTIDIEGNQLSGAIPSTITNITDLQSFNISINNFVFEDFEMDFNIYSTLPNFYYSPQLNIDTSRTIEATLGDEIILSVEATNSPNNIYQWRKDGVVIDGATNSTLTISNVSSTDLGSYDCGIVNPNVPTLVLFKNPINLINPVPQSEKDLLIALYNATGGPSWTNSWDLNTSPATWYGLNFNTSGRVTSIDLSSNNLTGNIPPEIGSFSDLETLFLLFNNLSGEIPIEIGNLTNLKRISVTDNQLTGTIPTEVGNMVSLERFFVNDNQLSGEIPIAITTLPNLEALSLTNNRFTGTIPSGIGNLSKLTLLNLSSNQFTGSIPAEIGMLTNLESLFLRDNKLEGSIPNAIGNLEKLFQLRLNKNQLSGNIPAGIKNIASLNTFDISENKFVFENIEPDFTSFSEISFGYEVQANVDDPETIQLIEGNDITLAITDTQSPNNIYQWRKDGINISGANQPTLLITNASNVDLGSYDCIITNPNIPGLNLQRNTIKILDGVAYAERAALLALYHATDGPNWTNPWDLNQDIDMWSGVTLNASGNVFAINFVNNNLSGTLPPEIGSFSSMEFLQIANNPALSGTIPNEIGNLSSLKSLSLPSNQLTGSLPSEIGNLIQLDFLNINNNNLTDIIPTEIGNLTSLITLSISENELSGTIPSEITALTNLERFSAFGNNFTGVIPSEIGNLTKLNLLSLSSNQFSGNIPPQIGNLTLLETLYLGNNQLTGSIPSEIGNLVNLVQLNLGNNRLTGEIPIEIGNLTKLETLFLLQNQLSGTIPTEIGNLINAKRISFSANQFSGEIPIEIWNLTNLERLFFNENQFTGSLPTLVGNLTQLEALSFVQNQLTGNIPTEIGNLTNLTLLNLSLNQFSGIIPAQIGNLVLLEDLFLYSNQLSGNIPTEIGNLTNLNRLLLYNNELSGTLPATIKNISSLTSFNISSNKFVFEDIESEFSALSSINFEFSPQSDIDTAASVLIDEGDSITLSVNATSSSNNSYSWYKDGIQIPGANSNSYIITSALSSDIGQYTCQITNNTVTDLTLTKEPIILNVNIIDADSDGVSDAIDNCPNTQIGAIVDVDGCSASDSIPINSDDIKIKVNSTSCVDKENGEIEISFTKDFTYEVVLKNGSQEEEFNNINFNSGLTVTDLAPGAYEVCVTSIEIPNFNQCFSTQVKTPEDLKVENTKVNTQNKIATFIVSGSKNYTIFNNSKSFEYNFADISRKEIVISLESGVNNIEVKTDKACQGKFNKTILSDQVTFYPQPANDYINLTGINDMVSSIVVTDLTGNIVLSTHPKSKETEYKIPVHKLATGVYIVSITTTNQTINTKISKQ